MIDFACIVGFDWDDGNRHKSLEKHGVTQEEAEQVFGDEHILFLRDVRPSGKEQRYQALGVTKNSRLLHVTFALRMNDTVIRVISARDMNMKERCAYD